LKVLRLKVGEALGESTRVLVAEPKADASAGIGKNGARHLGVQRAELAELLMRENQPEAILPRAGEELGERGSGKVVKLVDVKEEGSAALRGLLLT
jgi:hypothetical protein